jgi:hypothetical protein
MRGTTLIWLCTLGIVFAALLLSPLDTAAATTSFTWQSWRQRQENNRVPVLGSNNWVASGGTLSFTQTGAQSYIEDFVESQEQFAVEGIRIEWEMRGTVGTRYGYVGPYVALTQTSGTGWNNIGIGAHVWYRWETGGTRGAVLHAGRLGNRVIAGDPPVAGINSSTFARHVVTVSNGVVTWTVDGQTMSTANMGAAPYTPMRLMVGTRVYDGGVTQTVEIRNLTVTTGAPQYTGPMNTTVTGSITDSSGRRVAVTGSGHVEHRTVTSQAGSTSVTVSGAVSVRDATIGSVYAPFTGTYNAATDTFSGTYTDTLGGNATPFTFSRSGQSTWRGRFTGSTSTSTGRATYDLTVETTVPPEVYNSAMNLSGLTYSGPIGGSQSLSIPMNIPEIGVNTTATINISVTGNWTVQFAPGRPGTWVMSGRASGTFAGDRPISVTGQITQGPVQIPIPISVSISGGFGGTLSGTVGDNNVRFAGNWTATAGDQSFGGNVDISVPIDMSSGRAPDMSAAFSGALGVQVMGMATRSIPVTFSSNSPVTPSRP